MARPFRFAQLRRAQVLKLSPRKNHDFLLESNKTKYTDENDFEVLKSGDGWITERLFSSSSHFRTNCQHRFHSFQRILVFPAEE